MNFNKAQLGAIEHKDGAMLVLAGPGSGKTAVITHRTKNLITKHHVKPSEILVITFTKAAANEMKERFNSLMKDERVNVSFGTFHAVFFTILKYAYRFTSANIADESVRYGFIREILSYYRLEYKDENEFIGNLLAEISLIKNSRIDIENFYSGVCGEDYELLFTVPLTEHERVSAIEGIKVIGHITKPELGCALITRDGQEFELKAQGWNPLKEK
jgi:DNA helicase-2/ATP-dependent DNA helicase PcrA